LIMSTEFEPIDSLQLMRESTTLKDVAIFVVHARTKFHRQTLFC
jgi:hypothetical protein